MPACGGVLALRIWRSAGLVAREIAATLLALCVGMSCLPSAAWAQLAISDGGSPTYSLGISLPPGVAGMSPKIGIMYSGGGVNGPLGYGWTLQGISSIIRCAPTPATDGTRGGVAFAATDKFCLDGQRLIQTDASGVPAAFPQTNDSLGLSTGYREYRTEKDTYARVRAYGMAGGVAANGPAYFKVWTKSGQIYEYGNNSNSVANAAIVVGGTTTISAWAVSRISDTLGNYIDFFYNQRDIPWGTGPVAGGASGHEWNLVEIQYTGTVGQGPSNRVIFEYEQRPDNPGGAQDRAEAYHQGSKNVSVLRLKAIRSYINWPGVPYVTASASSSPTYGAPLYGPVPGAAVKVKTTKLGYAQGFLTNRSLVAQIAECVGAAETPCLPATIFTYARGGTDAYAASSTFNLSTLTMLSASRNYGVLTGDFRGTGRTDIIRWSDIPSENQYYQSNGDGSFTQALNFNGVGAWSRG